MALTVRTPLLGAQQENGHSEDVLDGGKYTSELWFLVKKTAPVIAGLQDPLVESYN
jgi:hypothetical protein